MKNNRKNKVSKSKKLLAPKYPSLDPFFADPVDLGEEVRAQTLQAFTRLLLWFAEGNNVTQRGVRVAVALYCVRPDLIDGLTLEQIGEMGEIGPKAVFSIAKDFRVSMGLKD